MRRFWMLLVALVALVIFMAVPTLAAEGDTLTYCLCGQTTAHESTVDVNGCDGVLYDWTPWDSTSDTNKKLPFTTGNYYLTESFTVGSQATLTANNTVRLDLNGHTITRNDGRLYAAHNAGSSLYITDTSSEGTGTLKCVTTKTPHYSGQGVVVRVASTSSFTLIKGKLDASSVILRDYHGGAVCVDAAGSTFRMYNGTIIGAVLEKDALNRSNGGAIGINNGICEIFDGTISGGKAVSGGVIYSAANGTLKIHGGSISGGSVYSGVLTDEASTPNNITSLGTVEITGGTIAGYVDLSSAKSISISGNPTIHAENATNLNIGSKPLTIGTMTEGADISITATGIPRALSSAAVEAGAEAYFHSDSTDYGTALNNSDTMLWLGHYDCTCAGAGENGACVGAAGGCDGTPIVWLPWTSTTSLPDKTGNWYLTDDVALPGQLNSIASGQQINLDLNGKTVTTSGNRGVWLRYTNITLTITDSVGGGTFKNTAKHDQGGIFWIAAANCHVRLINGIMDATGFTNRGTHSFGGAAVVVASSTGKFTMYGGEIKANKDATENIPSAGAAVAVSSAGGIFELHGGKIYGGKVQYQVYATSSDSGLFGGLGGAVYIVSGATMNMDGGEIIGGTAVAATATDTVTTTDTKTDGGLGGAVYLAGTLNMSGGKISGGSAVSALDSASKVVGGKGDNVYVASTGALNISGGEILGGVDASEAESISISGSAKINRGDATSTTYNLQLGAKSVAVGTMADGADIRFTATGTPREFSSDVVTAGAEAYFHSDSADYGIVYNGHDTKLWLGIPYCLCGSSSENAADHKHYMDGDTLIGCDGSVSYWLPWASTELLPTKTGNFYLTDNVVLSSQAGLAANSDVVLDLNGYKVTPVQENGMDKNMRMISIHNSGAKLTLTDTYTVPAADSAAYDANRTGGEIVTSATRVDTGNGVWVRWLDTFTECTTFVMLGGKITGVDSSNTKNGTSVSIGKNANFYMLGGTITGGKTTGNGGNVYIDANASMVMTGGTITSGEAARGANVYMNNGASFIMTGGTITKGSAANGGNVYVGGGTVKATFEVSGTATISEGTVTGNGGNIYINTLSEMNLDGATVTAGNAKNGGNICVNPEATLTMDSGSVTAGTGSNGQGIQVFGNLVVNGGKIENMVQLINWNVTSGASITLSGAAELEQIKLNKGTDNDDMDVATIELPTITIAGTLATSVTEGEVTKDLAPIDVVTWTNADAYISGATVAANAARFSTTQTGKAIHFVEGENKLYVGKYSCLCGANCGGATAGCDGQKVVWTAWSSESNNKLLPASTGNYYLTDSFTVSNQTGVAAGAQIRLDLNGQTVTRNDYRLYALNKDADAQGNYSALHVTDNSASGNGTLKSTLVENASYNGQGTVIWACKGNDFTLLRGNLDATGMITSGRGSAVSADDAGTVFKMYGGTVSGGTGGVGGTIGSSNGNVEIYGGTVNGGTATTSGGTIYSTGTLTINGGTINGGTAPDGGTIYSGGTVTIQGCTINGGDATNGGTIYSTGSLTINSGTVNGGTATNGGTIYTTGSVTLEGGTVTGGEAEFGGNFFIAEDGDVNLNGGTVSLGKAIRYESTGGNGGNFCVYGALNVDGATVSDGKAGTLDTDGTTVLFTTAGWGGNIYIYSGGEVEIKSGTIENGASKGNGGSIYMNTGTSLTISGGTVKNGKSHADQGGNIFCSGTLSITGGTISGGNAKNGGNIGINTTQTVSITGGKIQNGTATGNGGNIRTNSTNTTCTLTIGGTAQILGGSAKNGGNISVERNGDGKKTTLNIQGGTISGGSATANGGNINVGTDCTMSMTAGTVTSGKAGETSGSGYGGNIHMIGSVSISGGTVSNGQAGAPASGDVDAKSGWGGNIYISADQLTLGGTASISGGWANNNGGSIHVAGPMLMEGGSISGGFTNDRGGNIFVSASKTLTVTGGTISGGTAGGTITEGVSQNNKGGGNISTNAGAIVSLSNVTISDPHVDDRQLYRANIEVNSNVQLTLGDGTVISGGVGCTGTDNAISLSGVVNITGLSIRANVLNITGLAPSSSVHFTCSDSAEGRILTDALATADLLGASALVSDDGYRIAVNADNKLYLTMASVEELPGATINGSELVLPLNTAVSLVAGTNDWLQLNSDHEGDITVAENLNLDLNGRDLSGKITVASGKTLYLADSNNANYTDEGGRIIGQIEGDVAQVFLTGGWEGYDHNYRFVVLKDETDGVTSYHAHRIYLAVKSMVLHPGSSAINFRTVLKCDDTFKGYIKSYGATAKAIVDGQEKTQTCQYDLNEAALLGGGNENMRITRLSNILSPESQETWADRSNVPLSGQGTFTLEDANGTFTVTSAFKGNLTFKDLVLAADKTTDINKAQQQALVSMYTQHYELMKDWGLEKIPALSQLTLQLHCLCGDPSDTTNLCAAKGHVNIAWQKWTDELAKEQHGASATAATTLPKLTGNYYLAEDVQLTAQAGFADGTLVCIDTQDHKIESNGRVALVHAGATVHLTNSLGGNSQIIGSGHNSGTGRNGAAILNNGDLCIFKGITVTANNLNGISNGVIDSAGGVYIYGATVQGAPLTTAEGVANTAKGSAIHLSSANAKLYINSGTISGTDVFGNGGAICITNGEAEITGTAQINGSKAELGGAIYLAEGKLTLSGGTVSGGQALKGANIYIAGGQFDMTGGTLPGGYYEAPNTGTEEAPHYADHSGCNVYVAGGSFNMSGGQIKDAIAYGNGSNLFIGADGSATLTGGTISGGFAIRYHADSISAAYGESSASCLGGYGGNIYNLGSLTIADGAMISGGKSGFVTIEDGTYVVASTTATQGYGANYHQTGSATLTMTGGTVTGGKAPGNGGNIRADGGRVSISGGTVTLGQSGDRGGNIWMGGGTTLEVTGGNITSGQAKSYGGNIHCNNNVTISLTGGTITDGKGNNSAAHKGANVSVFGDDSKFTLGSATIGGSIIVNLDTTDTNGTGFTKFTGNPQVNGMGLSLENNKTGATFGPTVQIEDLEATASIALRETFTFPLLISRGELTDEQWLAFEVYTNNLIPRNSSFDVTFEADGIYMRKLEEGTRYSCECGANRGVDAHVDGCNGYDILWKEWDMTAATNSKHFLPTEPGYWYLTGTLTGTGENAYIANVGQTTISNDYYLDAEGNYYAVHSMLALNTAGKVMKSQDETYVSVAEYTTPAYADDVGAVAPPFAYKDVATGTTYSLEEAKEAGIVPLESYEIRIDLNGMKLESGTTSRMLSFRGSQGTLAKETYTDSEGIEQTRSYTGWRQAEATVSFIDSSEGHTGCLATYGVYSKGTDGQQLYRSSGTQWQGGFIWMPSETEDTLNTYYVNMDASTLITGSGPIYTSGKVNLWHSTLTGGTAQGCFNDVSAKEEANGSHDALTGSSAGGGALTLITGAEVTMHGGVIQDGTSIYRHMTDYTSKTYDRDIGGGNVFISDGTFTMYGGEIKGGRALVYSGHTNPELNYYSYGSGGGVYVYGGELILKDDAKITDNISGIATGTIVQSGSNPINAFDYVDVTTLNVTNSVTDNVYLGGNTLKAENFTGSVGYNTGKYIQADIKDYAGSLVSLSGNCPGTLTREAPSGAAIAATGNASTYLVGYGIANIHPTDADLKAGVIMTNYGNERDTSTLYKDGTPYDFKNDPENAFGSWDTELYATALATTDGEGDTVIVISVDSSTFYTSTANSVKRLISAATGVPMGNITISSGHQHSAPPASKIYVENEDGTATLKTNYAYTFYKGVLEAAVAAMKDRKQATVSVGTLDTTAEGKQYSFVRNVKILSNGTHVGMVTDNHSTHYKSGSDWYASLTYMLGKYTTVGATPISNPSLEYETVMDTTMQIVRYTQQGGTDIIMTNFQTHPHLGSGADSCYVQSDMIGAFRNYLAEKSGARVMYFSGASGNVNPTSKISADHTLYSYANHTCNATEALVQRLERVDVYGQTLAAMAYNFLNGTDYTTYNGSATKTVAMRDIITATTGSKDVKSEVRTVTYSVNTSSATEAAIQRLVMQTDVLQDGVTRSLLDWTTGSGEYVSGFSTNNEIWGRYVGYSSNRNDRIFSLFHAKNTHEMLMWQEAGVKEKTIDITAYALGEVGFVAAPYEMFQESGSDIKHGTANSQNAGAYSATLVNPFAMTIVATQANGGSGYIPSSLAYDNGGYSTDIANFAKGTAELLVTNYIDMLNGLK